MTASETEVDYLKFATLAALAALLGACSGVSKPEITLDLSIPTSPVIVVKGLSRSDVESLAQERLTDEGWSKVFRVSMLDENGSPAASPIAGRYSLGRELARFRPLYPLDPGKKYRVVFGDTTTVVTRPADAPTLPTSVAALYPSSDTLPANVLRMYVTFSAPMGSREGRDYLRVVDATDREIEDALLPLTTGLWNDEHTRFTVRFDPDGVKRRPLSPGMMFSIVVRRDWPDAHGHPLAADFRHTFRVGPAIERPLDPSAWQIIAPKAGSKEPLIVRFPWSLDRALLARSLHVARETAIVEGVVTIDVGEIRWLFKPANAWNAGTYALVAAPELEDVCGNRVGRAFETLDSTGDTHRPPTRLPFTIAAR